MGGGIVNIVDRIYSLLAGFVVQFIVILCRVDYTAHTATA